MLIGDGAREENVSLSEEDVRALLYHFRVNAGKMTTREARFQSIKRFCQEVVDKALGPIREDYFLHWDRTERNKRGLP